MEDLIAAHVKQSSAATITEFTVESAQGLILKLKVSCSPFKILAPARISDLQPGLDAQMHRVCVDKLKLELERPCSECDVASHLNPFLGVAASDYQNGCFCPNSAIRFSMAGCLVDNSAAAATDRCRPGRIVTGAHQSAVLAQLDFLTLLPTSL